MFGKPREGPVLAEHGRWVARLRDSARVADQRLRVLERRISAMEVQLADLTRNQNRFDIEITSIGDRLARLGLNGERCLTRSRRR